MRATGVGLSRTVLEGGGTSTLVSNCFLWKNTMGSRFLNRSKRFADSAQNPLDAVQQF